MATAHADQGWSIAVCGTTPVGGPTKVDGSWAGIGQTREAAVNDMKRTTPAGEDASGPCFALSNLTEAQAEEWRETTQHQLRAMGPGVSYLAFTGQSPPPNLQ